MKSRSLRTIIQRTFSDWSNHNVPQLGAALAFYTVLSLAPLLVLTLSGVALVIGRSASESQFFSQAQSLIGSEGTNALRSTIKHTQRALFPGIGVAIRLGHPAVWRIRFFRRTALGYKCDLVRAPEKRQRIYEHRPKTLGFFWHGCGSWASAARFAIA